MATKSHEDLQIYILLDELETILDESPRPMLGARNRATVDIDEIFDKLNEIRTYIPDDIRRAQGIIDESEQILNDAENTAAAMIERSQQRVEAVIARAKQESDRTIAAANEMYEQKVSQESVYLEAQQRSVEIMRRARAEATRMCDAAKKYSDGVLYELLQFVDAYRTQIIQNRSKLSVSSKDSRVHVESNDEEDYIEEVDYDDNVEEDDGDDAQPRRGWGGGSRRRYATSTRSEYTEEDDTMDDEDE